MKIINSVSDLFKVWEEDASTKFNFDYCGTIIIQWFAENRLKGIDTTTKKDVKIPYNSIRFPVSAYVLDSELVAGQVWQHKATGSKFLYVGELDGQNILYKMEDGCDKTIFKRSKIGLLADFTLTDLQITTFDPDKEMD